MSQATHKLIYAQTNSVYCLYVSHLISPFLDRNARIYKEPLIDALHEIIIEVLKIGTSSTID